MACPSPFTIRRHLDGLEPDEFAKMVGRRLLAVFLLLCFDFSRVARLRRASVPEAQEHLQRLQNMSSSDISLLLSLPKPGLI